jgi:Primase C terminal 2 (PriCT-2)/RepB DNA-primase N-terminal domain
MSLTAHTSAITVPFPASDQPTSTSVPPRDREEAHRFLRLLDPKATSFTFQTFEDKKPATKTELAKVIHSPAWGALLEMHARGAGVYVSVNATDGEGRKSENITRVRAIWQEDDDGHGGPFPLDPSLVIESSPEHFHRYWFVADDWPADEQGRADFANVMERMVSSYGSDKNAKDISRVLRLPGFTHRKDPTRPHMVRIVEAGGRRYTREEILRAFPPVVHEARHTSSEWRAADCDEERIGDALRAIPANDRDIWLQVGMALKDELGDRGRAIWDHWSATCPDKFRDRDQDKTWRSFRRNGIGVGTLFYHAQQHGWSPPRTPRSATSVALVSSVASDTWPQMNEAAYQGLAGEIVEVIEPHSEADPVALLIQFLTVAGNLMGRSAYYRIEDNRHHTNLFSVLVGDSSKSRKGTSLGRVRAIAKVADQAWSENRLKGGLSSGEGFISEVRDERREWNKKEGREEIVDPGVADKRLMVVEPEFASVLAVMERPGNTVSEHIRRAWDGDKLSTMTKHLPLCATGAHISIIGHITIEELRARLTRTEAGNGFANRFLFPLVRRSKELPFGGSLDDSVTLDLGERLRERIASAQIIGRVEMTTAAQEQWKAVYSKLSAAQPGLLGAVVARGEAQVRRLALTYALLDGVGQVDVPHLKAALAVWEYCETSAAFVFGNLLGDPVADEIARALQHAGSEGMTRTAIRDLFGRHRSDRIGTALALLMTKGRARPESRTTGGRSAEVWFMTRGQPDG